MALKRQTLTWNFQKVPKISFSSSSFLVLVKWLGNGKPGIAGVIGYLRIFFGSPTLSIGVVASSFSIEESFFHFVQSFASLALRGISSSRFPPLKVIVLTFSFGFIIV